MADLNFENALVEAIQYPEKAARPYVVCADDELASRIGMGDEFVNGVTISAVGFYGPQGRVLRLPIASPGINERIYTFEYEGQRITNYEMESAPLAGIARLLGHRAVTVCLVAANRIAGNSHSN